METTSFCHYMGDSLRSFPQPGVGRMAIALCHHALLQTLSLCLSVLASAIPLSTPSFQLKALT